MDNKDKGLHELLERNNRAWKVGFARRLIGLGVSSECKEYLEKEFPELAESEDERIRKAIVHLLEVASEAYLVEATGFKKEQFLSSLEKQKEKDRIIPERELTDFEIEVHEIIAQARCDKRLADEAVLKQFEQEAACALMLKAEKQKEQKPAEWSKEMGNLCLDAISLIRAYGEGIEKDSQLGQKIVKADAFLSDLYHEAFYPKTYNPRPDILPAEWSEEDELMRKRCITDLGYLAEYEPQYKERFDAQIDWLKALFANLKKKNEDVAKLCSNEWSKEDEVMLKEIISFFKDGTVKLQHDLDLYAGFLEKRLKSIRSQPIQLKEAYKDGFQTARHAMALAFMNYLDENRPKGKMCLSSGECEDIDKAFKEGDWAKIMRYYEKYRPSWKPSEEQMEALYKVAYNLVGTGTETDVYLVQLYEQLKKL